MTIYHKYDNQGNWLPGEQVVASVKPGGNYTDKPVPEPNYKPVFKNGAWVETGSAPPPPSAPQPSVESQLVQMEKDVADMWYALMMGGLA